MTNDQTILITGVTGNQGGAVAQRRYAERWAGAWGVFERRSIPLQHHCKRIEATLQLRNFGHWTR